MRRIRVILTGDGDGQILEWDWPPTEPFGESYAAAERSWGYKIIGRVEILPS